MAEIGDGVFYHGSVTDHHGLYTVVAVREVDGRAVLADPHTEITLWWARPSSFEVLIPATPATT